LVLSTSADDADSELEEEEVVGVRIAGCEFMSGFIFDQRLLRDGMAGGQRTKPQR
jgi:hypothetical protein